MSRLGAKTYSRKPDCKTSVQFDHLLSDKGNKPSTAKVSVAGIHRWGMTSFTSLRKSRINGQKEVSEPVEPVKRIKLEPTPPVVNTEDPFSFGAEGELSPNNNVHSPNSSLSPSGLKAESKPTVSKPNKFFKSGGSRLLKSTNSKNSDFDALRLSVPPNFNSLKAKKDASDNFMNVNSNYKNEVQHASEESSTCLTSTTPNIVNLRYCANIPNTCASTKYSNQPSIHYINSYIQPAASADTSSSRSAFDSLLTLDLSSKSNNDNVSHQMEPPSYFDKDAINNFSQSDILSDSILNHHQTNIGFGSQTSKQESSQDSLTLKNCITKHSQESLNVNKVGKDSTVATKRENDNTVTETDSQKSINSYSEEQNNSGSIFSSSQTSTISDGAISSSQSSDRVDSSNTSSKSRPKKIFSSSLKFKAVYNHRHWHSSKKAEESFEAQDGISLADEFEEEMSKENFNDTLVSEVSYSSSGDVRSFKCPKESKEFYTVVKNVKQAYQCHESGETQEFNDDIEYLLECVQENNAIGTRCLSVLNLATKCMGPAFRIHLRAHGTMPKIFSALKDAPNDPNLALCTATLMFVLSQDRLTMDIEASTLSLMLQLLETDPEMRNPEKEIDLILKDPALCAMQDKHREKVYSLCEEMQQKGHAKHLKLDNINTGILAMETLLSLTSRKAGEWFKEEMRTLRGLDRIVDTVTSSTELLIPDEKQVISLPTDVQLDKIRKIDRCLRVLENVTHMNAENQEYLFNYKNSSLILSCLNLMKLCKFHLLEQKPIEIDITTDEPSQKNGKEESPLLSCLLNLLKILSNITYRIPLNDAHFSSEDGLMDQILILILQVPRAVPVEKRFDLLVLSLGLMINLVEYCPENSAKFINMCGIGSFDTVNDGFEMPATEALIELMLSRLDAARLSEEQADELLSTQEEKHAAFIEKKDVETAADDLEETLMKTLQKAGKHMEHSIIAAYIVILLGCVAQKNPDFADVMKDYLPDGKFDVMVDVLKKFKSFVTLTGSVGNRELASIQRVIQVLESS
ncbi:wings apart-like protein homolog [Argiope bruennichi]|uniref:Wings apart-like protein like protein n=1 Tax=Argiope bruennichi TaxID=94029 RepID=A0A8T0E0N8_ARGBR|nr:wings apart-like protein homolog [Argiope bruennichi]KAF8763685.1 Wings apart-like protein like protein [Argiope bruennichi]